MRTKKGIAKLLTLLVTLIACACFAVACAGDPEPTPTPDPGTDADNTPKAAITLDKTEPVSYTHLTLPTTERV